MDGSLRAGKHLFEAPPPLLERRGHEVLVRFAEQIEKDDRCRDLLGQELHPRRRGVDAHLQCFEIECSPARDDDLAVEHAARGKLRL